MFVKTLCIFFLEITDSIIIIFFILLKNKLIWSVNLKKL